MDLGKKIYELRKKNNITQEQLANAIGVSTPAVCKWETGVSMPDISLLAPIARKLSTNLDDLLTFQETLSDKEIQEIVHQIKTVSRKEGLNAGIKISYEYLREYPNVEELKFLIATLPAMMAHTADDEYVRDDDKYQKLLDDTTILLEELTHSKDDMIRMSATVSVATRYMEQKRFDEAETMLKKIPNQVFDTRHLFPTLYLLKGEEEKAFQCTQSNMLQDIQHLLVDIKAQHTIYLKNNQFDNALKCAKDCLALVQIAGTTAMCGNELLVNTYLAMNQMEEATKYFINYIEEIKNISGNYKDAFYYSYIADKVVVASTDIEDDIRTCLYKYIIHEEKYNALRQSVEVTEKLDELKHILSMK